MNLANASHNKPKLCNSTETRVKNRRRSRVKHSAIPYDRLNNKWLINILFSGFWPTWFRPQLNSTRHSCSVPINSTEKNSHDWRATFRGMQISTTKRTLSWKFTAKYLIPFSHFAFVVLSRSDPSPGSFQNFPDFWRAFVLLLIHQVENVGNNCRLLRVELALYILSNNFSRAFDLSGKFVWRKNVIDTDLTFPIEANLQGFPEALSKRHKRLRPSSLRGLLLKSRSQKTLYHNWNGLWTDAVYGSIENVLDVGVRNSPWFQITKFKWNSNLGWEFRSAHHTSPTKIVTRKLKSHESWSYDRILYDRSFR